MRSRNITTDILNVLYDYKKHTYQEIAEKVECSYITVYRHIQDLSYTFNIEITKGGIDKGGVRLIGKKQLDIDYLQNDDLQRIVEHLALLQNANVNIKRFVNSLRQIS